MFRFQNIGKVNNVEIIIICYYLNNKGRNGFFKKKKLFELIELYSFLAKLSAV